MREKYHWKIFTVGIKEAFAGMEVKSHFLWLFTSFFPIFSIPSVKQNKKRQSPKGSKLFFINKVSIFISLKTQLLSNPPHPSMVFFYFCFFFQNQWLFPFAAEAAGAAGMLCNPAVSAPQESGTGDCAGPCCTMGHPRKWWWTEDQGLHLPVLSTLSWAINPGTTLGHPGFSWARWWLLFDLTWHNLHNATHPLFSQIQRDSF